MKVLRLPTGLPLPLRELCQSYCLPLPVRSIAVGFWKPNPRPGTLVSRRLPLPAIPWAEPAGSPSFRGNLLLPVPGPPTPVGGRTPGRDGVALRSPRPQATRTPTRRLFRDRRSRPQKSLSTLRATVAGDYARRACRWWPTTTAWDLHPPGFTAGFPLLTSAFPPRRLCWRHRGLTCEAPCWSTGLQTESPSSYPPVQGVQPASPPVVKGKRQFVAAANWSGGVG